MVRPKLPDPRLLPRLLVPFGILATAAGASPENASPEDVPLVHDETGVEGNVFAYGERLQPPYVFTGLDADTLFLNGHAYFPRRRGPGPGDEAEDARGPSEAENRMRAIGAEAESAGAAAPTPAEGLEAALQCYLASPEVEHARIEGERIRVKFRFFPHEIARSFAFLDTNPPGFPGRTLRDEKLMRIRALWRHLEKDRIEIFGADYAANLGPSDTRKVLARLEEIEDRGLAPTDGDELGAMGSTVKRFLRDFARANGIPAATPKDAAADRDRE